MQYAIYKMCTHVVTYGQMCNDFPFQSLEIGPLKQCIHIRARAHACARVRVLYRFSSFLVKGFHTLARAHARARAHATLLSV